MSPTNTLDPLPVPPGAIVPHPAGNRLLESQYRVTVDDAGLRLLEIARIRVFRDVLEQLESAIYADASDDVADLQTAVHRLAWFWSADTRGHDRINIARAVLAREGHVTLTWAAVREILARAGDFPELAEIDAALHDDPDAAGVPARIAA